MNTAASASNGGVASSRRRRENSYIHSKTAAAMNNSAARPTQNCIKPRNALPFMQAPVYNANLGRQQISLRSRNGFIAAWMVGTHVTLRLFRPVTATLLMFWETPRFAVIQTAWSWTVSLTWKDDHQRAHCRVSLARQGPDPLESKRKRIAHHL